MSLVGAGLHMQNKCNQNVNISPILLDSPPSPDSLGLENVRPVGPVLMPRWGAYYLTHLDRLLDRHMLTAPGLFVLHRVQLCRVQAGTNMAAPSLSTSLSWGNSFRSLTSSPLSSRVCA